jgi:23S rRNA (pseudouridine1915-N3)-methyltransferase
MRAEILCVGKTRPGFIADGIAEYEKRVQPWINLEWKVLPAVQLTSSTNVEGVKSREAQSILAALNDGVFTVVLDEQGTMMDSVTFADLFDGRRDRMRFVIGGTYGLDASVRKRADLVLSFSRFTFTHEMIRMFLTEQIYRAMTIRAGKKYHY